MRYFIIVIFVVFISCDKQSNLTPKQIKTGTFKTIIKEGNYESMAVRNDSLQIETFNKKIDTFYINWINNFEYVLRKRNPKTDLDKKEFVVKITGVKEKSYTFSAYFKGSNYKQKGEAIKIE